MQLPNLKQYCHLMKTDRDLLFRLDCDYVFRDVYAPSEELLALPADSFLNKRLEDIFPPDTAGKMRAELNRLSGPENLQPVAMYYSLRMQGHIRYFSAEVYRETDGEGNCFLLAVVTEVPAGNTHPDFFSLGLDLMCLADLEGRFVRCNPAWTTRFGYREEELTGRSVLEFIHPEDRKQTLVFFRRLERTGELRGFVNRYQSKDGQWCWLDGMLSIRKASIMVQPGI